MAAQFQTSMQNVASITDRGRLTNAQFEAQIRRTGQAVVEMSRQFPQSAKTLADGLYNITSSGFQGAEAMSVLKASALSASAGLSTTDVAAKAISASLNAYGKSGFEAKQVSDILFATVKLGVVTFEELAQGMGDWVGMAASAKVPLQDASSALATMTLNGISASEASTSLNLLMRSMLKPTAELTKVVREHGYETVQDAVAQAGLHGVMEMVRDATGGNAAALITLFPEIRAARGAYALLANDMGSYNRIQGEMGDLTKVAGEAQKAYNEQSKSFSFQLQLAKNNLGALAIGVGQTLLPVLSSLLHIGSSIVTMFQSLDGPARTIVVGLALLTAGVLALGGGFLLLAPRIMAVKTLMASLREDMPNLAGGLGVLGKAAGVAAVAMTVGTLVMAQYGEEKRRVKGYTDEFVSALEAEAKGMKGATEQAVASMLAQQGLVDLANKLGVSLDDVVKAALGDEAAMNRVKAATRDLGWINPLVSGLSEIAKGHGNAKNQAAQNKAAMDALGPSTATLASELDDAAQAAQKFADKLLKGFNLTTDYADAAKAYKSATESAAKAQESLATAAESAARAQQDGARSVADASQRVQDAVAKEAEAAVKSADRIASARQNVADAVESSADRVTSAERRLADAEERERQAQEDLTQARKDAQQELDDLHRSLERDNLSVERAELRLEDARAKQAKVNASATATERDRLDASLDVREAELDLADAQKRRSDEQQKLQTLEQQGIENSKQVLDAEKKLADASQDRLDAEKELTKARVEGTRQVLAAEKALHDAEVQGAKDVADAQRDTAHANEELATANEELARASADGARRVADAQREVDKALKDVADNDLSTFFARQSKLAEDFVNGVAEAARRGLDPTLIQQLLEAGPEKAKPILDAIAADHTGGLIKLANETQAKLTEISKGTIELARATYIATTTTSQEIANEWDGAMKILAAKAKLGAAATAKGIAQELGIGEDKVRKIAKDYVIDIDSATSTAKRLGITNAQELSQEMVRWIEEGTNTSDARLTWFAQATGVNLAQPKAQVEKDIGAAMADLIDKVAHGTNLTDQQMAWWAAATGVNLAKVASVVGATAGGDRGTGGVYLGGPVPVTASQVGMAEGGFLPGQATFMPAQGPKGIVQWAENETEGEWFLPHAMSKRKRSVELAERMLRLWGYTLQPAVESFAYGGTHGGIDEYGFDRPPAYPAGVLTSDAADTFTGLVYEMVRKFMAEGGGSGYPGPAGPAAPAQVQEWVRQGVALAGGPPSWAPPEVNIAMFESGGDPHAINLWDWNAQQGHPSKGLMQMIDSTFRAYMVPGHGDIWNPVDNAASATGYIRSRYGDPWHTPGELSLARGGSYQGYSLGGLRWHGMQLFDTGGALKPGVTMAVNRTGGNETVLGPHGQSIGVVDQSITISAGAIQVEVRVAADANLTAVRDTVRDAIRSAQQELVASIRSSLRARAGGRV